MGGGGGGGGGGGDSGIEWVGTGQAERYKISIRTILETISTLHTT